MCVGCKDQSDRFYLDFQEQVQDGEEVALTESEYLN